LNDTTVERKTADLFLKQINEVLEKLRTEWNVIVVGFTSDASGESRKARKMLLQSRPELIVLDCYAHQVCLSFSMVKAYRTYLSYS
jgi:hypothetical protein